MKILWHGGEQEWLFRVIPYIRYRESIPIAVIPDIVNRESIFGFLSDGSPRQPAGMTAVSRHSRLLLAGIQAVFFRMDPRRLLAGMTTEVFFGLDQPLNFFWQSPLTESASFFLSIEMGIIGSSMLQVLRNSTHREEGTADSEQQPPSRCKLSPHHSNHSSFRSGLWCRHAGRRPRGESSRFGRR